ncbi:EAL domain-containing response regulator [Vibrio sp. IB15]|uniref:EAL domain-containing response regulator n=1 Tax=Vibrio sp. IB15 TaxID=2779368 RepID=UPI0018E75D9A|nr:EAL domain-containing response regulator [Vibrio sp. IB15]MBJ2147399.1 EAL domain-containing response regulator [Vibrio sp. IB15]
MDQNIVVIEDHPFQLNVMTMVLNSLSVGKVHSFECGCKALDHIEQSSVDLILCDLNMPMIDGIELLKRLANLNFKGNIIITSAENQTVLDAASKMCKAFNLNLLGVLEKPIDRSRLLELVSRDTKKPESASSSNRDIVITDEDIVKAVENHEMVLHYQPIVCIHTGEWKESESLIRWQHPHYGVLSPFFFLTRLIDSGLMLNVLKQLLEQAINDQRFLCSRRFVLNLTAKDMIDGEIVDHIFKLIDNGRLDVEQIKLELTESDLVESVALALASTTRICMRGIPLAIDDFGTGYSSLKQLEDLPFSALKLDIDFVKNIQQSRSSRAIVRASLYLAKLLDLTTVAEGIEDISIWTDIRSMSNKDTLAQGYFIARPMPADQLPEWKSSWEKKVTEFNLLA